MSDPNPFADLVDSPRMYPWRFDPATGRVVFVAMTPESYRQSRFLDHRLEGAAGPAYDVAQDKLVARFDREGDRIRPPPMRLVFHVGYTGSTLISRCLESLADALVLREPEPLRTLAAARSGSDVDERTPGKLLGLFSWLWSRAWRDGQPVIVKATSSCNTLMADLLGLNQGTRALFVYSPLKDFLLAAARHPARFGEARAKLAAVVAQWPVLPGFADGPPPPNPDDLDDFQVVAALWWAYLRLAGSAARASPPDGRVLFVNFAGFLSDPAAGLARMARHLDLPASAESIDAVVRGPLMTTHAKSSADTAFQRADREAALEAAYAGNEKAVEAALGWARSELSGLADLPMEAD